MPRKPIDRRVMRTRMMLQQALISLSARKSYEAITVEAICEVANVGRSTFYAHYTGKDDLFRSGFEHLRRELAERQENAAGGHLAFSLAMFEHAREHVGHYRALVGRHGGAIALGAIRQILTELIRREFAGQRAGDATEREATVQFLVGAYLAVLTWWLDAGAKLPPRRVDEIFRGLALGGIDSAGARLVGAAKAR